MNTPALHKDQLKKRRAKKLFFKVVFIFLGAVALASLFVYLMFFAGFFDIKNVKIDGNFIAKEEASKVANDFLSRKKFWLPAKLNLFLLDKEGLEFLLLDSFPSLESATVNRKLLHELEIQFQEKIISGIWCFKKTEKCFFFDKKGIAFEEAPQSSGLIFLHIDDFRGNEVRLKEKVIDAEWLEKISQSKEELEKQLGIKVKNAIIPENSFDEFSILTHYGWKLKLAISLDIPFQIESLKIFINQKLTPEKLKSLNYIDARIENKFYYQ